MNNLSIKLPVIVCSKDGSDILITDSLTEAASNLEYADVKNGLYSVYDSEGFPLKMSVEYKQQKVMGINLFKTEKIIFNGIEEDCKKTEITDKMFSYLKNSNKLPSRLNAHSGIADFLKYKKQING